MSSRWPLRPTKAPGGVLAKSVGTRAIRIACRPRMRRRSLTRTISESPPASWSICKAVAQKLTTQLGLPSLRVAYVPVTALDRFETIQQRKADLLCEATSVTLSRREVVDFQSGTCRWRQPYDPARRIPAICKRWPAKSACWLATTEQVLRAMLAKAEYSGSHTAKKPCRRGPGDAGRCPHIRVLR